MSSSTGQPQTGASSHRRSRQDEGPRLPAQNYVSRDLRFYAASAAETQQQMLVVAATSTCEMVLPRFFGLVDRCDGRLPELQTLVGGNETPGEVG